MQKIVQNSSFHKAEVLIAGYPCLKFWCFTLKASPQLKFALLASCHLAQWSCYSHPRNPQQNCQTLYGWSDVSTTQGLALFVLTKLSWTTVDKSLSRSPIDWFCVCSEFIFCKQSLQQSLIMLLFKILYNDYCSLHYLFCA